MGSHMSATVSANYTAERLEQAGGLQAIAYLVDEGCVLQRVKLPHESPIGIRYRGCYYIIDEDHPDLAEGVKCLKGKWFLWLRRLSSWTRYINVTWQLGE